MGKSWSLRKICIPIHIYCNSYSWILQLYFVKKLQIWCKHRAKNVSFKKNSPPSYRWRAILVKLLLFYNCFAVIVSARFAHSVRQLKLLTIWALYHAGQSQFPVCSSFISSCFWYFSLRYCHVSTSRFFRKTILFQKIFEGCQSWVNIVILTIARCVIEIAATNMT